MPHKHENMSVSRTAARSLLNIINDKNARKSAAAASFATFMQTLPSRRNNTIYNSELQKTIVRHTQPRQRGTLMQPCHCDPQRWSCKAQELRARNGYTNGSSKAGSRRPSEKNDDFEALLEQNCKR